MSDNNSLTNSCPTKKKRGRPRLYDGASRKVTFRLREGVHDEILEVLDSLPGRTRSAWVVHALLCYVRGEVRNVVRESQELDEELEEDLFSMFEED